MKAEIGLKLWVILGYRATLQKSSKNRNHNKIKQKRKMKTNTHTIIAKGTSRKSNRKLQIFELTWFCIQINQNLVEKLIPLPEWYMHQNEIHVKSFSSCKYARLLCKLPSIELNIEREKELSYSFLPKSNVSFLFSSQHFIQGTSLFMNCDNSPMGYGIKTFQRALVFYLKY